MSAWALLLTLDVHELFVDRSSRRVARELISDQHRTHGSLAHAAQLQAETHQGDHRAHV